MLHFDYLQQCLFHIPLAIWFQEGSAGHKGGEFSAATRWTSGPSVFFFCMDRFQFPSPCMTSLVRLYREGSVCDQGSRHVVDFSHAACGCDALNLHHYFCMHG